MKKVLSVIKWSGQVIGCFVWQCDVGKNKRLKGKYYKAVLYGSEWCTTGICVIKNKKWNVKWI